MNHQLTAVVALFITVVASCNACDYKKFTPNHTACRPRNSSCNILNNKVTKDDKELVVRLHNQYREKVAMGRETAAGGLPTASNMMEMVWDDELAMIAQKLVETCKFEHDCGDCRRVDRFNVGQNLYISMSTQFPTSSDVWKDMATDFYDEVSKFKKEYISPFKSNGGYGHFTQMVWAESWRLGCGKVVFNEGKSYKTLIACNYGPAGNVLKKSMYKIGKPCSACPSNTCCGDSCKRSGVRTNYQGLCTVICPR